jgi:hypothetical protein
MVTRDKTEGVKGFAEKIEQHEEMLNKRKWAKDCLSANIAQPEQIISRGVNNNV